MIFLNHHEKMNYIAYFLLSEAQKHLPISIKVFIKNSNF